MEEYAEAQLQITRRDIELESRDLKLELHKKNMEIYYRVNGNLTHDL